MGKLTVKQQQLLDCITRNPGFNTHHLAESLGDYTSYETNLRDRGFALARLGLVTYQEILGKSKLWVVERKWFATTPANTTK